MASNPGHRGMMPLLYRLCHHRHCPSIGHRWELRRTVWVRGPWSSGPSGYLQSKSIWVSSQPIPSVFSPWVLRSSGKSRTCWSKIVPWVWQELKITLPVLPWAKANYYKQNLRRKKHGMFEPCLLLQCFYKIDTSTFSRFSTSLPQKIPNGIFPRGKFERKTGWSKENWKKY